jgi:hypothetical protein
LTDLALQRSCEGSSSQSLLSLPSGLLANVLSYTGAGEWAFAGAVSKFCQEAYLSSLATVDKPASSASHRVTTYAAAVASVSRLQEAIASGLPVDDDEVDEEDEEDQSAATLIAFQAGQLADRDTLLWLKANCADLWREALCDGAVVQGRLGLLTWLHDVQQCPWSFTAGCYAALHNQLAVLQNVYSRHDGGVPEPDAELTERAEFSLAAVESDNAGLLQWCYEHQKREPDGEDRLHYCALTQQCPNAAEWLVQHGFEDGFQYMLTRDLQAVVHVVQQDLGHQLPPQELQVLLQDARQRMMQDPRFLQLQQQMMQPPQQEAAQPAQGL